MEAVVGQHAARRRHRDDLSGRDAPEHLTVLAWTVPQVDVAVGSAPLYVLRVVGRSAPAPSPRDRGEKRTETEDKDRLLSERFYGRFERRIPLDGVDEDKVSASFKNGVLNVVLPKSAQA